MAVNQTVRNPANSIQNWLITIAVIFFSVFSVLIALICIFALPDRSSQPLTGGLFFLGGVLLLVFMLMFRWSREKALEKEILNPEEAESAQRLIIKETLSDKFIKWLVTIFSLFFVIDGVAIALICIYALPTGVSQPKIGALYFAGSAIVLGCFIIVVCKSLISEKT